MELIEKKVSSLNEMFVAKIINGEYEIVEADEYAVAILIGDKYKFSLWIANSWDSFRTYYYNENFMILNFNSKERGILFYKLKKQADDIISKSLLDEKKKRLKEIEELESKLGK